MVSSTQPQLTAQISPRQPVIEAYGLVKRYGATVAANDVDLVVNAGEIFGILGPNGAGKTTVLEMIEGLRKPDAGSITIAGFDTASESEAVRRVIGVQLQTTALFDYLTAAELLRLFAGLYEVDDSRGRVDELLAMVGLEDKRDARVRQMSGGQQQRLSIALGLVNRPLVAFLDEPTTGLDPAARRDLWQSIREIRDDGTTVVLTTHYMEEAEVLCDRLAIMDSGRIIALDSPQELIRSLDSVATIRARIERGSIPTESLAALPDVTGNTIHGSMIELRTRHPQRTLLGLLDLGSAMAVELVDLRSSQATLEDVFLTLTGRTYQPEEATAAGGSDPAPAVRRFWKRKAVS